MSNKKYLNVFIKGLHCRSCELLIEEKFKDIKHVQEVQVNYKTGEAAIAYTGSAPDVRLINQAIIDAGYEVGAPDKLPLLTKDKREYVNLGIAFLILMILYLSLKGLGLTNINLTPDLSNPSWGLIIVIGLVAGFSTCMAMVGGLSLGLSTKFVENHPQATPTEKFRPHLFFIFGRILAYAWLGGILGVLGMAIKLSTTASGFITVFVGLIMLLMGLQLINIFPRLNRFKLSLPKGISKALGIHRQEKEYTHKQAMVLGALTFFLPCGFTQAMQLYAISTGNFALGALVMGLFAIGTAPGLLSIGGVTSLVKGNIKERFFKVAGLAVIFFGLFNLSNGYTLASLSFDSFGNGQTKTKSATVIDPNVTMENGVQIVRMVESNRGYSPNSFSVKKGVPVKWIIDAQAQYSCASALIVPKLGIQKNLTFGENIIEFTPQEVGKLPFSCSMGMYTGVFNVYEDNNTGLINSALAAVAEPAPVVATGNSCGLSSGGCGCGGGGGTTVKPDLVETVAQIKNNLQVISGTYTSKEYLQPNSFEIKAGIKTRLTIDVKNDGSGCGYSIMIPGLYSQDIPLKAGENIVMEFTPTAKGVYDITCGMDMIRYGTITVK